MALIKKIMLVACIAAVLLPGCAMFAKDSAGIEKPSITFRATAYKIGKSDQLLIDVWRNPELTRSITVRPDGFITMPLIGDILAEGRKPEELAVIISDGLKTIIKNPEVTVTVSNPASIEYINRVRIMGEVNQPTSLQFVPGLTVMDLVLAAGGVSPFGAEKRAQLSRLTAQGYKDYQVDLKAILEEGDTATNYLLQPTDIITVPERSFWRGEF